MHQDHQIFVGAPFQSTDLVIPKDTCWQNIQQTIICNYKNLSDAQKYVIINFILLLVRYPTTSNDIHQLARVHATWVGGCKL